MLGWVSNLQEDSEVAAPADWIKSLCKIYEGNEEGLSLIPAFLLKLSEGQDNIDGELVVGIESTLGFWDGSLCRERFSLSRLNIGRF